MLGNLILFNLVGALGVAWPKISKSLTALLLSIKLSVRRGCRLQRPQSGTAGKLMRVFARTPFCATGRVQLRLPDLKVTTAAPFYLLTTCYPLVHDVQRPKSGTTGT